MMKHIIKTVGKSLILLLLFIIIPLVSFSQTITFDDTEPEIMVVDNGSSYEVGISKLNGTFVYIKDKSANAELMSGETTDILWSMEYTDGSSVRSTNYLPFPGEPSFYSYSWSDSTEVLTMTYSPDSTANRKVRVVVTMAFLASDYFDIQINVHNEGEGVIRFVSFPKTLWLSLNVDDRVYVPINFPGIEIGSEYFEDESTTEFECDYISFLIDGGNISIYQLYNDTCIQTVVEGLYAEPDPLVSYNYLSSLRYYTWIEEGNVWTSQVSRIRIGQTPLETIHGFRVDNSIDQYPTIQDKLGSDFETYARSPVFAYCFPHWDPPGYYFSDVQRQLASYPDPAILFFWTYFDAYCTTCMGITPEYYPPLSILGSAEDFQDMLDSLQARGFLTMLMTLPLMWHSESATLLGLPDGLTIEDVAVIDSTGNPQPFDHYGDPYYYISPSSPFVQEKFDEIYDNIFVDYGADIIYEDAATYFPVYDFNKYASSPVTSRQEWLNYYKDRSHYPILVEGTTYPMTEYVTGVMGTNYKGFDRWDYSAGDGYWRPYPLVTKLYNDKVITHPSSGDFTKKKYDVAWHTFFGCPFLIDMDEFSDNPYWNIQGHVGWIPVIHEFQGRVTARIIGKQLIDYLDLEGPATKIDYGDIFAVLNWDPHASYDYDLHAIASHGIYVQSDNGDLEAGILTMYNGADLSPGDHYLIVETFADSIEVRHPMGASTPIQVSRPEDWTDTLQIHVYSITQNSVSGVTSTFTPELIQFELDEAVADTSRILKYLILYGDTLQITSVVSMQPEISEMDCYPNPFTDRTSIRYEVLAPGKVLLRVMDLSGKEIRTLKDSYLDTGNYMIEWDGNDDQGLKVPSGMYFIYCIQAKNRMINKIIIL